MKYSVILAFAAGAFALPQEGSSITSAPASAASASLRPQESCVLACPAADVNCQASCVGVARPNTSQVLATNECAAKCDQGDGSKEDTDKYAKCLQDCFASHFPSTQTTGQFVGNPAQATGGAGASMTNSAGQVISSASGTGAQPTGSESPSGTAASASNTPGAANSNNVKIAGAGLAGLAMAIFAL